MWPFISKNQEIAALERLYNALNGKVTNVMSDVDKLKTEIEELKSFGAQIEAERRKAEFLRRQQERAAAAHSASKSKPAMRK